MIEKEKLSKHHLNKALKTVNYKKNFDCKEYDKVWLEIQLMGFPYSTV